MNTEVIITASFRLRICNIWNGKREPEDNKKKLQ